MKAGTAYAVIREYDMEAWALLALPVAPSPEPMMQTHGYKQLWHYTMMVMPTSTGL
jgi:hypothetical protein